MFGVHQFFILPATRPSAGGALGEEDHLRNTEVNFSIWDLGGQREFLSMLPLVCNEAAAIFFMFDLSIRTTRSRSGTARHAGSTALPAFLVGTKYDRFLRLSEAGRDRQAGAQCMTMAGGFHQQHAQRQCAKPLQGRAYEGLRIALHHADRHRPEALLMISGREMECHSATQQLRRKAAVLRNNLRAFPEDEGRCLSPSMSPAPISRSSSYSPHKYKIAPVGGASDDMIGYVTCEQVAVMRTFGCSLVLLHTSPFTSRQSPLSVPRTSNNSFWGFS